MLIENAHWKGSLEKKGQQFFLNGKRCENDNKDYSSLESQGNQSGSEILVTKEGTGFDDGHMLVDGAVNKVTLLS